MKPTPRAVARAETMRGILTIAARDLSTLGPAALSLRAIAREMGMVSSGIYRYVASRDELLTLLIIEAYQELGDAVTSAEASIERSDQRGRYAAFCHSLRDWALANPHRWALLFGTPVPGYAAPQDTIPAAQVAPMVLVQLLQDEEIAQALPPAPDDVQAALQPVMDMAGDASATAMARGVGLWGALLGIISAELFGHTHNVVAEDAGLRRALYEYQTLALADGLGLLPAG